MGTQREVAKAVVDGGGDHRLPVKALLLDATAGPVEGLRG